MRYINCFFAVQQVFTGQIDTVFQKFIFLDTFFQSTDVKLQLSLFIDCCCAEDVLTLIAKVLESNN